MNYAPRSSPSRAQRRSARIPLRVRLHIRLSNDAQVDGETVMISRYGAKLRIGQLQRNMVSGDQIRLCQRGSYNWRTARVAWIDRITTAYCGIELDDPQNFWGVYFPELISPGDSNDDMPRRGPKAASIRNPRYAPPVKPSNAS